MKASILSLLFGCACFFNQSATAGDPPSTASQADLSGLKERWLAAMKEAGVPGMVVVAVQNGQVILMETLGHRDPDGRLPVTPDTAFYIASCTKPFVAFGIMMLVEQGKLKLDAPVKSILPRFELSDPKLTQTVTIRDLLSHKPGISGEVIVWLDAYTGQVSEDRYYHFLKEAQIAGQAQYSNVHFTLLGRVIEAITGQSWKDYLAQNLFEPAQMKSATAYADKMYAGNAAIPCTFVDGKFTATATRKTDRTMHAAGGLGASANDLAQWLLLNLGQGEMGGSRLLSAESANLMCTTQSTLSKPDGFFPNHQRTGFGLAWTLGKYRNEKLVEHGGGYIGSSAWITFLPDRNMGVAAVANAGSRLPYMAVVDVYDRLLGVDPMDLLPKVKAAAKSGETREKERRGKLKPNPGKMNDALSLPLDAYAGKFTNQNLGTFEFTLKDEQLLARCGDLSFQLGSTAKDEVELSSEDDDPRTGRFFVKDGAVVAFRVALFEGQDEVVFRRE